MATKQMSELEQHVMDIIWAHQTCSVREIAEELSKERTIAYTTVLTIAQRLYDKGLVNRKEDGKAHVYLPKISKENYTKTIAKSFVKKFIGSFGDVGIA